EAGRMSEAPRFVVGLDLGQTHDYTALAVVERVAVPGDWELDGMTATRKPKTILELHLRHAERFERNLPYPAQVQRVAQGLALPPYQGHSKLIVDRTGVGRAVFDMFGVGGLKPVGVTITAGVDAIKASWHDWRVPKRDLVAAIQVPLGEGRLKIAAALAM